MLEKNELLKITDINIPFKILNTHTLLTENRKKEIKIEVNDKKTKIKIRLTQPEIGYMKK